MNDRSLEHRLLLKIMVHGRIVYVTIIIIFTYADYSRTFFDKVFRSYELALLSYTLAFPQVVTSDTDPAKLNSAY